MEDEKSLKSLSEPLCLRASVFAVKDPLRSPKSLIMVGRQLHLRFTVSNLRIAESLPKTRESRIAIYDLPFTIYRPECVSSK
jgi:hypothetical protein